MRLDADISIRVAVAVVFGLACAAASAAQVTRPPSNPGLVCQADDGKRSLTFITPTPNLWLQPEQSIHPNLQPAFNATWEGLLHIPAEGSYLFHCQGQVWIDGKTGLDQPLPLPAGTHPLRIHYDRPPGQNALLLFEWESEPFGREPVPAQALSHSKTPVAVITSVTLEQARARINELNCVACHLSSSPGLNAWKGPDLSNVGHRLNSAWIFKWLENPRQFRPSATMPMLLRNAQERADVTAYLAGLKTSTESPPEFQLSLGQIEAGGKLFEEIGCAACHDSPQTSLRGLASKMTGSWLTAYLLDPLQVHPSGLMPDMNLQPDEARALAAHLLTSRNRAYERTVPSGDPNAGRELVRTRGCVQCHDIQEPDGLLTSQFEAAPFEKLRSNRGCLSLRPSVDHPHLGLNRLQTTQIASFLRTPVQAEAPVVEFHRLTQQLRCQTCHALNGQPHLASLPGSAAPSLTGAPHKLQPSWIKRVLHDQKRIRPWMSLRMPHFSPDRVAALFSGFQAMTGLPFPEKDPVTSIALPDPQTGFALLGRGSDGLGCVQCHDFQGRPTGLTLRAPDLTEVHQRLKPAWLARWCRDPLHAGLGGKHHDSLARLTDSQRSEIQPAIQAALSAGSDMPDLPELGRVPQDHRLQVAQQPLIVRTFLKDASPRSFAVGLSQTNFYAFDADACRLLYAWSGDFLDLSPTQSEEGDGLAVPLGDKYYVAPDEFPVRVDDPDRVPEVRFRGCRVNKNIPEFFYEVDGILMVERITSTPDQLGLERRIRCGRRQQTLWIQPGSAEGVTVVTQPTTQPNGLIKIPPGPDIYLTIRLFKE